MARGRAAAVWLIVGTMLTAAVAGIVLIPEHEELPTWARVVFTVMTASLGIVGALVVTRQPRNAVGWILWSAAIAVTLSAVAAAYGPAVVTSGEPVAKSTAVIVWASQVGVTPAITAVIIFVPLLFPDGRYLSPRWRWAGVLGAGVVLTVFTRNAFMPGPFDDSVTIDNPFGIPALAALRPVIEVINGPGVIAAAMLAVASSVIRYRRGSAIERAQLRWFGAATGLVLSLFTLSIFTGGPVAEVGWIGGIVSLSLVPIAIGVAILRYRLYEIDRIISRTIGWAIVTGMLVTVFAVVVVSLQALLASVTDENTFAVAASTLVAFALFQPVRRRVQRAVDRRFDRARYDGQQVVDAFGERLRHEVDVNAAHGMLVATASEIVRPQAAGVWLRNVRDAGEGRVS